MFKKILVIVALLATCSAYAGTEEFTVTMVEGGNTIALNDVYDHFQINTDETLTVRFIRPALNSSGEVYGVLKMPEGDASTAADAGAHPDISDTTMTITTALTWNTFNDVPAKKIIVHGATAGTVLTIKAKK